MKPYTPDEYRNALNVVRRLVQAQILNSPEASNRPTEEAAAVLGPIVNAVQVAALITPSLRIALNTRQMKTGAFNLQRPSPDADEDAIGAFLILAGTGLRIARESRDPFPALLAVGLTVLIAFQAFIIMAGVTRLLPLTGVTLPFVSYGGSSLVANYVLLSLLVRISDQTARRGPERTVAG